MFWLCSIIYLVFLVDRIFMNLVTYVVVVLLESIFTPNSPQTRCGLGEIENLVFSGRNWWYICAYMFSHTHVCISVFSVCIWELGYKSIEAFVYFRVVRNSGNEWNEHIHTIRVIPDQNYGLSSPSAICSIIFRPFFLPEAWKARVIFLYIIFTLSTCLISRKEFFGEKVKFHLKIEAKIERAWNRISRKNNPPVRNIQFVSIAKYSLRY